MSNNKITLEKCLPISSFVGKEGNVIVACPPTQRII